MADHENRGRDEKHGSKGAGSFDEVWSAFGTTFARKGRWIHAFPPTGEERIEIIRAFAESADDIETEIEEKVRELELIIAQHNPFDMLASLAFANALIDPETYKEYEHKGNPAYTQYLACLYLTKPESACTFDRAEFKPGPVAEDIQERIQHLFFDTAMLRQSRMLDSSGEREPGTPDTLRIGTMLNSLVVRNPAYPHHLRDVLTGIWNPIDDRARRTLGFGMSDALAIADAMTRLVSKRLEHRHDQARESERNLRKAVKRYRQKGRQTDGMPADMCRELALLRPSEAAERIKGVALAWVFFAFGENLLFAPGELATESGIELARCEAFLNGMSLAFGQIEPQFYRHPSAFHPLMLKPLIRHEGRFFLVDWNLLYNALRLGMEALINPDHEYSVNDNRAVWEAYEGSRSGYLERMACQYMADALGHATVYRKLSYHAQVDGQDTLCELDGLLILDSVILLVECKAGTVSPSARRGAPKRMVSQLAGLVQHPHKQAVRAKEYIDSRPSAVFGRPDGSSVSIDGSLFRSVFLITITLDYLEAFVTNLYELKDVGLLDESDMPWAVSLTDLRVIGELVEFPSQFVHYLLRRKRPNELELARAHDELDWFGHYLKAGLYFGTPGETPHFNLLSYTTEMDSYYLCVTGARETPAPKPAQKMPDVIREIVRDLEEHHPGGGLSISQTGLPSVDQNRDPEPDLPGSPPGVSCSQLRAGLWQVVALGSWLREGLPPVAMLIAKRHRRGLEGQTSAAADG